jgi:hypothetical protein
MTTPLYALLRDRCGLTIREASEFHRVSFNTVKKWSSGHRKAPDGALKELRDLYGRIEDAGQSGDPFEMDALPCEGARDAARGLADLWADENDPPEDG